jgi:hypothetical protein
MQFRHYKRSNPEIIDLLLSWIGYAELRLLCFARNDGKQPFETSSYSQKTPTAFSSGATWPCTPRWIGCALLWIASLRSQCISPVIPSGTREVRARAAEEPERSGVRHSQFPRTPPSLAPSPAAVIPSVERNLPAYRRRHVF